MILQAPPEKISAYASDHMYIEISLLQSLAAQITAGAELILFVHTLVG